MRARGRLWQVDRVSRRDGNMKKADAEIAIMSEWRNWKTIHVPGGKIPSGTEALIFFGDLQQRRPDLLTKGIEDIPPACFGAG